MSQKGAFGFRIPLIDEQVSANEMKYCSLKLNVASDLLCLRVKQYVGGYSYTVVTRAEG